MTRRKVARQREKLIEKKNAAKRIELLVRMKRYPNYRFSLAVGYQVDRAALLSIRSRVSKVVKDLSVKD